MWKYNNIKINPGQAWTDLSGVRHPKNWHIWSDAEKAKYNITEVVEDSPPDSRLYKWAMDNNGKITSTAKPLDSIKLTLKHDVKTEQGSLLSQTDWAYIRHYDAGIDVPAKIETWRNAIRAKAIEMEKAIDDCSSTDDIAKLWLVWDKDKKKSGILYDWPELEE